MISRDRKKELLLEIISETNNFQQDAFLPIGNHEKNRIITNLDPNFIFQDRFSMQLESQESFIIGPEKIKGFRIENIDDKRILKVKTILHIDEWINDFKKIEIIKIYFFDMNGNVLNNSFDYDVSFKCFYLDCDYTFRDYLTPIYEYEILASPFQ